MGVDVLGIQAVCKHTPNQRPQKNEDKDFAKERLHPKDK